MRLQLIIKRVMDIVISLLALIFLSPLMILTGLLVFRKLGWPVFFFHDRPGRHEKIFKMIKFRSMLNSRDSDYNLLPDAERLTPFGKLLRRSSMDELPELYNVLKGEMSLVGPRPLLASYLPLYTERQRVRHLMRPGITGWAQINGRNTINWDKKLEYDAWYIENWSLFLDFKILLLTIEKVVKREGVDYSENISSELLSGTDVQIKQLQ